MLHQAPMRFQNSSHLLSWTKRDVNLAEISVLPKIWRGRLDWTVSKMIGTFDPKTIQRPHDL